MADQVNPGSGETVIGTDAVIKGEMSVETSARILGTFEGTIHSKGRIQVADKAKCKAAVQAGVVHVDGLLEGDITATDKAELNATAKVKGDLVAPKLIVLEGAAFSGHVSVGPDAVKEEASRRASGRTAEVSLRAHPRSSR